MSNICNKCGTTFDSPFCPNCGTQAQQPNNQETQQTPPQQFYESQDKQNQYTLNPKILHVQKKKKHGCLLYGLIAFGIIFLLFIILSILSPSNDDSTTTDSNTTLSKSTTNEDATSTPAATSFSAEYLAEDEIQYIYSSPKDYIGKRVKLSGVVIGDAEKNEKGVYFQMFQNVAESTNNTIVAYYGNLDVKSGDYVVVDGIVKDEFKGENYFGATLNAPAIEADSVEISTYQDVVSPAIKTLDVSETQDQLGYQIIVEKIEFSPIETRVFITINNNGSSNFSAYSFNMKIKQGDNQYEEQANYEADYPEIQTGLMPGTKSSGVVCFPVLSDKDDFTLYMDGSSDNWEENIEQYVFEISNK